ncbi:MAG: class I SAM-dependent methyltransferase [Flavobacteriaceae bacterium]|nr:class I SAM-dependent methyltransferase [Flavobacteriaceae bacterium]
MYFSPMQHQEQHPASFRDPSGYVIRTKDKLQRIVLPEYFPVFEALEKAQIFEALFKENLLISHQVIERNSSFICLEPQQIPFITYPYEWSFDQYKHAALTTLKAHRFLLKKGFVLKDATAFNIAFYKGKPILLDTLSLDRYQPDTPWRAYRQFIMHFLLPLVLAVHHGAEQLQLLKLHLDGVPLELGAKMLPYKTKWHPFLYAHVHLQAKLELKFRNAKATTKDKMPKLSLKAQLNLVEALYNYIKKLELKQDTEWDTYYHKANYSEIAFDTKKQWIRDKVNQLNTQRLVDLGGNDGTFSRIFNQNLLQIIVCDIDERAVNENYQKTRNSNEHQLVPMVINLLNPSPGIGFEHTERAAFTDRIKAFAPDCIMALALVHHLCLSGNIPFHRLASYFASLGETLIVEFPKREDSWVKHLLQRKMDFEKSFDFYHQSNFETAFAEVFSIVERFDIPDAARSLYLMRRK